jgi:DNA-binding transcriptional regulator GbsR (MarR family)
MSIALPEPMRRLIDFLGQAGVRWGLPYEACRVHGYLYLRARPVSDDELREALGLDSNGLKDAITWLDDYRLIEPASDSTWRTQSDPWASMMQALEERRRREARPALDILRECRRMALVDSGSDPVMNAQIGKLLMLVEDLSAIDTQTHRLSPKTLRQIVGIGGRAARLVERTFGRRNA